jgi:hypothetical protein
MTTVEGLAVLDEKIVVEAAERKGGVLCPRCRQYRRPPDHENIAVELERIAEIPEQSPEFNHHATERLRGSRRTFVTDLGRDIAGRPTALG